MINEVHETKMKQKVEREKNSSSKFSEKIRLASDCVYLFENRFETWHTTGPAYPVSRCELEIALRLSKVFYVQQTSLTDA